MPDILAANLQLFVLGSDARLPVLSLRNAFPIIVLSAVVSNPDILRHCAGGNNATILQCVHLVCKKWEPMKPRIISPLLLFIPSRLLTLLIPHYGPALGIVVCFLIYWTALSLSVILYRISPLHPLYNHPRPLPAKVTKWWHIWQLYKGKQRLYIQRMHDAYGDIVLLGA